MRDLVEFVIEDGGIIPVAIDEQAVVSGGGVLRSIWPTKAIEPGASPPISRLRTGALNCYRPHPPHTAAD
jgi:hypothetical protein